MYRQNKNNEKIEENNFSDEIGFTTTFEDIARKVDKDPQESVSPEQDNLVESIVEENDKEEVDAVDEAIAHEENPDNIQFEEDEENDVEGAASVNYMSDMLQMSLLNIHSMLSFLVKYTLTNKLSQISKQTIIDFTKLYESQLGEISSLQEAENLIDEIDKFATDNGIKINVESEPNFFDILPPTEPMERMKYYKKYLGILLTNSSFFPFLNLSEKNTNLLKNFLEKIETTIEKGTSTEIEKFDKDLIEFLFDSDLPLSGREMKQSLSLLTMLPEISKQFYPLLTPQQLEKKIYQISLEKFSDRNESNVRMIVKDNLFLLDEEEKQLWASSKNYSEYFLNAIASWIGQKNKSNPEKINKEEIEVKIQKILDERSKIMLSSPRGISAEEMRKLTDKHFQGNLKKLVDLQVSKEKNSHEDYIKKFSIVNGRCRHKQDELIALKQLLSKSLHGEDEDLTYQMMRWIDLLSLGYHVKL